MKFTYKLPKNLINSYINFVRELYKRKETAWINEPSENDIKTYLETASLSCFAIKGKDIIGHAGYHVIEGTNKGIVFIAVNKNYRRKKIGTRLMQKVLENAFSRSIGLIAFIKKLNKPSINFFKKTGFSKIHSTKDFFVFYMSPYNKH
jgi:GNAT superfamily N-acetyltransferase